MKRRTKLWLAVWLLCVPLARGQKTYDVASPDGKLKATVELTATGTTFALADDGRSVLSPSPVSLTVGEEKGNKTVLWGAGTKVKRVKRRTVNDRIQAVCYKRATVTDHFNEMTLQAKDGQLVVRVYDDGAAYRFVLPDTKKELIVYAEQADFAFDKDYPVYLPYANRGRSGDFESQYMNSFENYYEHKPMTQADAAHLAFLPVLVEQSGGCKLCITEADLCDYPGMYVLGGQNGPKLKAHFAPLPSVTEQGGHNRLQQLVKTRHDYIARNPQHELPWRVFGVSRNDAQLAQSDLVFRLGKPSALTDTDWIRPGKVAWDWWNDWNIQGVDFRSGINNETYKYYIDFASKNGIEYVILDEGWSVNLKADLMQVVPQINLPELVAYARERRVGLILWAGYWAFHRDMEKVVKHYADMGIKGFKVDFMDRDDQQMVRFIGEAAALCAKYKMMVDFHGMYKPMGMQRTWPNVINYEGVNGLEQMKWTTTPEKQVQYDVELPFIRQFAGPMDYTQGAMRNGTKRSYVTAYSEPMSIGTRCHQLGLYMVFDSPLNMLCDAPTNYEREDECTRFIAQVPTVWDETLAPAGVVGQYVVMARRSGDVWYVGAVTNWTARDVVLDLSFLPEGGNYEVELFRDGINADRIATDYKREVKAVPADRRLQVRLQPGGGCAARIVKK